MAQRTYATVGDKVREHRKAAGLRQVDLAAACQIAQHYLSMIETGSRVASEDLTERLAETLGVRVEDITEPAPA